MYPHTVTWTESKCLSPLAIFSFFTVLSIWLFFSLSLLFYSFLPPAWPLWTHAFSTPVLTFLHLLALTQLRCHLAPQWLCLEVACFQPGSHPRLQSLQEQKHSGSSVWFYFVSLDFYVSLDLDLPNPLPKIGVIYLNQKKRFINTLVKLSCPVSCRGQGFKGGCVV